MSLKITNIKLKNFRSYSEFELSDIGDLTIFVGPNASGKTNAIEAIQLLTAITSFKHSKTADLIKAGESALRAELYIGDENRFLEVALSIFENTRAYFLNGKKKTPKDLYGILPAVVFTPDDLSLSKGSDKQRRGELDYLGIQVNSNYYQITRDFEKIWRHKNKLLKEETSIDLIFAVDEIYSKVASQLTNYRRALFARLMPKIEAKYFEIASEGETLEGKYIPSWPGEIDNREDVIFEEISAARTLLGPHLDVIKFEIDGMDVRSFASQGQQRSIVLALKLAEAELIEEISGTQPILLLDDVMSELDEARRGALVKELLSGHQTFITTANIDYFDSEMLDLAKIVKLG